ncbi:four helix bundle protein [Flavobacterium restrictum]|uniref:four helix bundle protein n=1 Tax=Flavobacterium restrictum TaxID=2594428 RepID=UPI003744187F
MGGRSDKEFLFKLEISHKEAQETIYWLKLLKETDYISSSEFESVYAEAEEIYKNTRQNYNNLKRENVNQLKIRIENNRNEKLLEFG